MRTALVRAKRKRALLEMARSGVTGSELLRQSGVRESNLRHWASMWGIVIPRDLSRPVRLSEGR